MLKFWKGKKVLITGHTGFKGSWLSLWLQLLHAELVGFSLPPATKPNLFTLARVADNMTSIIGDVRDFDSLRNVISTFSPEIIIHMAAQSIVRYSYQEPLETYMTNTMGTLHLLEAVRIVGCVRVLLNVTSDKCYENKEQNIAFKEEDQLGGFDPYSNSKACSELITSAYRNSFFNSSEGAIGIASARAGNVIGGGDWALDRLVPDIINACINRQSVLIRSPHAVRPWQHVLNSLSGYLLLAQCLYESPETYVGAWNFGPNEDDARSVDWLANHIIDLWGSDASRQVDIKNRPVALHEANFLRLDSSKAKQKLGWQPRWSLSEGLRQTVSWYRDFARGLNMHLITLNQIKNYMGGVN